MKIIDLLNKIANGEEVPKKIKINEKILNLKIGKGTIYEFEIGGGMLCFDYYIENNKLNTIVEIIEEEKKIPEKLKIEQDTPTSNYYIRNENETKCGLTKHSKMIAEKVNQLIDYLQNKGDE